MRSFTVGQILDIPIRVNVSLLLFLPLLVWLIAGSVEQYVDVVNAVSPVSVAVADLTQGSTPELIGVVGALGLFVGVLLHELGHAVAAMRHDVPIASITLWIFGGLARMERLPEDWNVEFWIALAGPVTSVGIAAVCYAALLALPAVASPVVVFLVAWLAVINLTLAIFNMLPAFPMDGGRVLRALLARRRPYVEATSIAARIGRYLGVGMVIVAVLPPVQPVLALVGLFVYVAAGAESRVTALRDVLRDVVAGDLLTDEPRTVRDDESVSALVDRMLSERRTGYPVLDGAGSLVGLVSLPALRSVPAGDRAGTSVADVMHRDPPTVGPDTPAFEVLELLATARVDRVVVLDRGEVLGTLDNDDVVSYIDVVQGIGPVDEPDELLPREGYACGLLSGIRGTLSRIPGVLRR